MGQLSQRYPQSHFTARRTNPTTYESINLYWRRSIEMIEAEEVNETGIRSRSKWFTIDSEPTPPRITSNVKQNLQFLRLWKRVQHAQASTSYRRKKVEKEELPEDTELYRDLTTTLYYTNQGIDNAVPVLLVDGYNVCGYWPKLKKHFIKGRLDVARQKLIEELVEFSMIRGTVPCAYFPTLLSFAIKVSSLKVIPKDPGCLCLEFQGIGF
ncbi:YacP-like NYN domain-containing protein [Citrus sinensis]|uniref:YacP-like NYN domain-containing protein n=1 Tax=Citrus sinensis TaxID=2711 RepID=A0ACB8K6J5_CITSI|nr:YacP-like NYN domain-containing protein [Citrus sinensis]